MQVVLEAVFDACLTRVPCARIVRGIEPLQVVFRQRTHVADRVSDRRAVRIMPNEARLKVDAGEARSLDREVRDLLVAETKVERNGFESRPALAEVLDG